MNCGKFSKARIIGLGITLAILASFVLAGCQKTTRFSLEQVPQEYRSCAVEVVPELKKGPITARELVVAYAELKKYAHKQNTCLKGLIKWADAQHSAYYQSF